MLLIGIDEAGYGPLLGPLVVAGAAFRVERRLEPADADAAGAIVREALAGPCRGPARLLVDDSKRVYGRGGLAALERAPLALLASLAPAALDSLDGLLRAAGSDPHPRRRVPWYAAEPPRFPLANPAPELRTEGCAAQERLAHAGAAFLGAVADVLPEGPLNASFERTGNKAETLFDASLGVADRLRGLRRDGEPVVVVFDRHGGRKRYGPHLQGHHPDGFVWTLGEADDVSAYRVQRAAGGYVAEFRVGADAAVPPVALASMLAKYLRELFMVLWNDWFARLCPDVRPTAGYAEDGRRWLAESRTARIGAGIPDDALARVR